MDPRDMKELIFWLVVIFVSFVIGLSMMILHSKKKKEYDTMKKNEKSRKDPTPFKILGLGCISIFSALTLYLAYKYLRYRMRCNERGSCNGLYLFM